jgi:phospholipid transport system substrate-binding protein
MIRHTLAAALLMAAAPAAVRAQTADPAISTIEAFDSALLEAMKGGKALGAEGRFHKLQPAVERAFDLPVMTRFAVGSAFAGYSPAEQAALTKAFGRLTTANLAKNFDSYNGETFKIDPNVQTRGLDKLVKTEITPRSGAPTALNYRMRQSASGTWKVIDVYFGAVSQLTAQRSDFASTATPGNAAALIAKINGQADKLLR